jgi:hypothetical protein
MALQTVVEVALHFESFRNVDLFHQGLYHLKTRLYRDDGENRLMAIPYAYSTSPVTTEKPKPARTDHHHLIPAHIIEDQYTFSTRSFLIRYCEEEVELNDIGQFRVEVGVDDADLGTFLILEVDLMFADLTQHGGADRFGENPDVDSTEFKSVSTQYYRIHRFGQGLHECCPIVFDEFHFCLANLVVHSCLLDYRFRLRPALPVPSKPKTQKAPNGDTNGIDRPAVPTSQNAALSMVETLYGSHRGSASREELMQVTEALYQKYIGALAGSYSKLVEFFEDVCNKCLTPAQLEAFADIVEKPGREPFDAFPVMALNGDVKGASTNGSLMNGNGTLRNYLNTRIPANANAHVFAMQVSSDLSAASCQMLKVWHRLLTVVSYSCREITCLLRRVWERRISNSWSRSVIKYEGSRDVSASEESCVGEQHSARSDALRASDRLRSPATDEDFLAIQDMSLKPDWDSYPILFEQRYLPKTVADLDPPDESEDLLPSAPKRYRGVHLFVLVHGWQGNSFDMRLMKNNLALLFPDAIFLCATSNEDNTEGDMNESGIRLAQEVVNYICDWCPGSALGRLSFITFSCGGLIVRAALPLLHEYSSKMFTLMMLSCQHLGFLSEPLSMVSAGLWGLTKWRKSKFLEQMSMSDATDIKESFIYRLSKTKGLEYFKWVAMVSCKQDQFAPYESARALMYSESANQPDKEVYAAMVRNLWEPVKQEGVFRFDVNFSIPEKNLDAVIGRAAHIRFLECQPIMKMIMHNYSFLFR